MSFLYIDVAFCSFFYMIFNVKTKSIRKVLVKIYQLFAVGSPAELHLIGNLKEVTLYSMFPASSKNSQATVTFFSMYIICLYERDAHQGWNVPWYYSQCE